MAEYTYKQWGSELTPENEIHADDCYRWQAGIEAAGGTWDGEWVDLDKTGKGLVTIDQFNALEQQIQSKVSSYTPKNYDPDSTVQIVPGVDGWNKVEDGLIKAICQPDGVNRNLVSNSASAIHTRTNTSYTYLYPLPLFTLTDFGSEQMKKGGTFSFSFDYEITGITTACTVYFCINYTSNNYTGNYTVVRGTRDFSLAVGDNSGHYSIALIPREDQQEIGGSRFGLWGVGAGNNEGAVFTFTNIKYEVSEEETAWVPAPEDYGYGSETLSATPQSVEDSDEVAAPEAEEIE